MRIINSAQCRPKRFRFRLKIIHVRITEIFINVFKHIRDYFGRKVSTIQKVKYVDRLIDRLVSQSDGAARTKRRRERDR